MTKTDDDIKISDTNGGIARRLAEPFDVAEIKWKPGAVSGNRALAIAYVDCRVIQSRLDEVLGVDGWSDDYECLADGSVVCRLRLRIGGEWITKVDVSGGDRLKAAFSDALKRAAVKFGVGQYLYRLPTQWCDWDMQRRQFVNPPTLPPWAMPSGLTPEQVATLTHLIGATGSDFIRFLKHFGVERLADLNTSQYETAVKLLNSKVKK